MYGDGPLGISYPNYVYSSAYCFLEGVRSINMEANPDINSGRCEGSSIQPLTAENGKRSSAYDAYYLPARDRENLTVSDHAQVHQIEFETKHGRKTASAVLMLDKKTGRPHRIAARKEIILAAGAFQTPQLLMLSVSRRRSVLWLVAHLIGDWS